MIGIKQNQLETARLSNTKKYWNILKGSTNINSKFSLSSSDFLKLPQSNK